LRIYTIPQLPLNKKLTTSGILALQVLLTSRVYMFEMLGDGLWKEMKWLASIQT